MTKERPTEAEINEVIKRMISEGKVELQIRNGRIILALIKSEVDDHLNNRVSHHK